MVAVLLVACLPTGVPAQDAKAVVAAASKTMGVDNLNAITYSGSARNGAFGQSKSIGEPMGPVNLTQITQYTRTINFDTPADPALLVSRATGPTQPPTVPGAPPPTPGVFNQNITATQVASFWGQAQNIWTTPWGFIKLAGSSNGTVRQQAGQQVVSFSPEKLNLKSASGQPYTVTGYINAQNLVTKVETHVEHAVAGDLLVQYEYSNYQNMNGVQVPGRIVQRQGGLQTFDATITAATPNPPNLTELLTAPPPPGRGGAPGAGAPPPPPPGGATQPAPGPPTPERIGEGVFKIGGNYTSLAIDLGDHILVVESGQNAARGMAVMAAARQAIPNKKVRFVVNSHPHFDHAGGLAAAAAEGATILTHRNNEPVLKRLLGGPRTLDVSLPDLTRPRVRAGVPQGSGQTAGVTVGLDRRNLVEAVGDRAVRKGSNGKVVELHRIPNEHSDGLLAVYLPAEKVVWTADITAVNPTPAQLPVLRAAVDTLTRLKLDYTTWIQAHPPNPDKPITRAEVEAAAKGGGAP
jgi:glyoxylase-like metal-dependent hydrolase (beta-lactamase superfamily II)